MTWQIEKWNQVAVKIGFLLFQKNDIFSNIGL